MFDQPPPTSREATTNPPQSKAALEEAGIQAIWMCGGFCGSLLDKEIQKGKGAFVVDEGLCRSPEKEFSFLPAATAVYNITVGSNIHG